MPSDIVDMPLRLREMVGNHAQGKIRARPVLHLLHAKQRELGQLLAFAHAPAQTMPLEARQQRGRLRPMAYRFGPRPRCP